MKYFVFLKMMAFTETKWRCFKTKWRPNKYLRQRPRTSSNISHSFKKMRKTFPFAKGKGLPMKYEMVRAL